MGKSALTIQVRMTCSFHNFHCSHYKFINGQFQAKYDPTIEDRYQKVIDYQGVPCFLEGNFSGSFYINVISLSVLDTAGQDTFVAMRELYMRNGEGFALIFALNNIGSLRELEPIRRGILKAQGV